MVKDHLGNKFTSIVEMCAHYGIKFSNFEERLHMCAYYNSNKDKYNQRRRKGYPVEQCLGLMPIFNQRTKDFEICDNMIIHHNISKSNYFLCTLAGKEIILHHDDIIDYYRKNILHAK